MNVCKLLNQIYVVFKAYAQALKIYVTLKYNNITSSIQ